MSKLDGALDAAVREMVADDGPPDLRAKVLARIGEPPRRRPAPWAALAAAAGIVVAVASFALLRTGPVRPSTAPGVHQSVPAPSVPQPALPPAAAPLVARAKPVSPTLPVPRSRSGDGRPEVEEPPLDLEAGGDLEPIELVPLAVVPISGEHIAVTALTIERMEIEPLAEPQP